MALGRSGLDMYGTATYAVCIKRAVLSVFKGKQSREEKGCYDRVVLTCKASGQRVLRVLSDGGRSKNCVVMYRHLFYFTS